jgi:arylsulfatase A
MKYLSVLLLCFSLNALAQDKTKPNIVFVMADDLGYGELGCYGNTFNETPNLDQLAKQSMRFTEAYSAAPICSPSRVGILTGQYPARTRITDFLPAKTDRWLDPAKYYTVNEALSAAGYHTGIVGKWHLDTDYKTLKGSPKAHGFDEVIGSETKYIADGDYTFPYDKISTFSTGKEGEYLTDRQSEEGCQFIERNKNQPFFLYLTYYSVHTKLEAPEELVNKYKRKFDQKYGEGEAEKYFGADNIRHENDHKDNPYLAAMLERIDAGVGQILKKLKEDNLDKNTIFIFFSDNGGAPQAGNNGILRAGKSWLYEGGIREPLIVNWPGKIKAGTENNEAVCSVDFYPTFLSASGQKPNGKELLDGVDLLPLLTQGKKLDREALYWHYPSETGQWVNRMASAVRKGDYKLINFYKGNRFELYNIKEDISEQVNLAEKMPAKLKELKQMLFKWRKEVNAEVPDIKANEPSDSTTYFTNPIGKGADPWVTKVGGFYYASFGGVGKLGKSFITVSKSNSLTTLGERKIVWFAPEQSWNSKCVWAPEIHHIKNKWYIYYAAGKSGPPYTFQRSGVLESVTDDPQGKYIDRGMLKTGVDEQDESKTIWAIDLTVTEINNQLYAIWSGWEGNEKTDKTEQHLYIAKMKNPYTISSERVKISSPVEAWETGGPLNLNEGPEVLKHEKDVFIIYSTRESWLKEYRLGQLKLKQGTDPMVAANWQKKGPVFEGTDQVLGVGHASFTTSPNGDEDWIFYHSKISTTPGWQRNLRLQQFFWDKNGDPLFGIPIPAGKLIKKPSGER